MSARTKGIARKQAAADAADAAESAKQEAAEAATWEIGAKKDKNAAKQAEQDEKLRKKAETAALLAEEETVFASIPKKKTVKKKGKDDFDMLNAALSSQPKSKAQKEKEAKAKALEEKKKQEKAKEDARAAQKKADEAYRLEQARRGIIVDHSDDLLLHSKDRNQIDESTITETGATAVNVTGIESALDALSTGDDLPDGHPEKRRKALYNAYLERQLPIMKEEHPGLRLNQYKERIFELWQKSPENPVNQAAAAAAITDGNA